MTLAYAPTPIPETTRDQLARNDVRRGLTALLRRRVPPQEVEDVAQTVLADALSASVIPTDPEELRRWLTGIARHKIADFHRRAARTNARTSDAEPESIAASRSSEQSYEEREILESLLNEPRTRRDAETLEWLVREHAGERLQDIASETKIPATVVRQRVSRLRRAIRSRWVGVFGLVALLAGLSYLGFEAFLHPSVAITPEPTTTNVHAPVLPASATPFDSLSKEVDGDWIVQTVTSKTLTPNEKRIVDTQAKGAVVHIHDKTIELEAKSMKVAWRVDKFEKTPNGGRVHLVSDSGGFQDTADVVVGRDASGPRLEVTLHGRFGGTVLLRRPVL